MTTKFKIEKYNRIVNFILWQIKMCIVLAQQWVSKALKGKDKMLELMSKNEKEEMDEKALTNIQLCLSNEVLREVTYEKTAASF